METDSLTQTCSWNTNLSLYDWAIRGCRMSGLKQSDPCLPNLADWTPVSHDIKWGLTVLSCREPPGGQVDPLTDCSAGFTRASGLSTHCSHTSSLLPSGFPLYFPVSAASFPGACGWILLCLQISVQLWVSLNPSLVTVPKGSATPSQPSLTLFTPSLFLSHPLIIVFIPLFTYYPMKMWAWRQGVFFFTHCPAGYLPISMVPGPY